MEMIITGVLIAKNDVARFPYEKMPLYIIIAILLFFTYLILKKRRIKKKKRKKLKKRSKTRKRPSSNKNRIYPNFK